MTDPEVHALIGPYVLNALPAGDRERFEAHLAACEFCQAEVAELREASSKLAEHVAVPPPPDLKSRVMAAVDQTRQLPPSAPFGDAVVKRRSFSRRTALSLAAAGLAVALTGGLAVDQYRARTEAETQAAQASARADRVAAILAQPDARTAHGPVKGGGQVTVVTSHNTNAAVIILHNLHDLPRDRTWQLWLIDKSQQAHSIALTPTDGTHITTGVTDMTALGLTIEPTGGSSRPTLPTAAQVPLTG